MLLGQSRTISFLPHSTCFRDHKLQFSSYTCPRCLRQLAFTVVDARVPSRWLVLFIPWENQEALLSMCARTCSRMHHHPSIQHMGAHKQACHGKKGAHRYVILSIIMHVCLILSNRNLSSSIGAWIVYVYIKASSCRECMQERPGPAYAHLCAYAWVQTHIYVWE